MSDKLELVKAVAPFAAPLTAAIVKQWVKPKLAKLHKYLKTDKALFEHTLATKFDEYLQRTYERNSYINVIVFQNQRINLEDIYIPLTVKQAQNAKQILLDSYKEEFVSVYKKILIKDTAGMGKTTVLKHLFLSAIKQNKGTPIFIELRKLKGDKSILNYVYNELNPIDDEFDENFILNLIKEGDFIFFLDGYDEIPFSQRDEVTRDLQEFISKAGKNFFILTSRPESTLASFTDFQEFNIQPLKLEEAFRLIKKYDRNGELSAGIISKLKGNTLRNLNEFLTNPLLVSLLYKSYEYKPILPFKKHIFYRQVYDSLFESHDLTKGGAFVREKYSGLDIEDFHTVLRSLGFLTIKLGQIEFEKDRWLTLINEAREYCKGIVFKESNFFKDLLTTVPLFDRDGEYFKWAHKSIQEYFAAQFICKDTKANQGSILQIMWKGRKFYKYYNVLDLCFDIDYRTFRKVIIYEIISQFLQYYDSSYTSINRDNVKEPSIHIRKILTFGYLYVFLRSSGSDKNLDYEVIREFLEKNGISVNDYEDVLVNDSLFLIAFKSYTATALELLYAKKVDIFDKNIFKEPRLSSLDSQQVDKMLSDKLLHDLPVILDENPNSIFNQEGTFDLLNKYIAPDKGLWLNYDKCLQLREQIQKEIEEERSEGFLFDKL